MPLRCSRCCATRTVRAWLLLPLVTLLSLQWAPARAAYDPPVRLALLRAPGTVAAGALWAAQPAVEATLRDDFGSWHRRSPCATALASLVPADASDIDDVGAFAAPPLATAAFVGGWANFSGLAVAAAGSYRLLVAAPGVAAVLSPPFVVTPGPPARWALVAAPAGATGGRPFLRQPALALHDAWGNAVVAPWCALATASATPASATRDNNCSAPVAASLVATASIVTGPPGGVLGGALTVQLAGDVAASFADLRLTTAGSYVLRFHVTTAAAAAAAAAAGDAGAGAGVSAPSPPPPLPPPLLAADTPAWLAAVVGGFVDSPVTVTVGRTARLVVRTQPAALVEGGGQPLGVQPVVELQDAGGNVNVHDSHSTVRARLLGLGGGHPASTATAATDRGGGGAPTARQPQRHHHHHHHLSPLHAWSAPFPLARLNASVVAGSHVVQLAGDVAALLAQPPPGTGLPPLASGSEVALGWPEWAAATVARQGSAHALRLLQLQPGAWGGGHPAFGGRGAVVRRVHVCPPARPSSPPAGDDHATCPLGGGGGWVLLDTPWDGPTLLNATLWRVARGLTAHVVAGVASFVGLAVLPAGARYRLLFTVSSPLLDERAATANSGDEQGGAGAAAVSAQFDVRVGAPFALAVRRGAGRAWAGNQPFGVQPAVALVDAGGNVVGAAAVGGGGAVAATAFLVFPPPVNGSLVDAQASEAAAASLLLALPGSTAVPMLDARAAAAPLSEGVAEFAGLGVSVASSTVLQAADAAGADVAAARLLLVFTWQQPGGPSDPAAAAASPVISATRQLLPLLLSAEWMVTGFPRAAAAGGESLLGVGSGAGRDSSATAWAAGLPRLGDRFGHAVSVAGSSGGELIAAVSAPYADAPQLVQRGSVLALVRLLGASGAAEAGAVGGAEAAGGGGGGGGYVPEVQTISLAADWRPEVQRVTLVAAAAGAPLAGWVSLQWAGRATRNLSVHSDAGYVQAVASEELFPLAGGEDARGVQGDVAVVAAADGAPCHDVTDDAGTACSTATTSTITWTFTFANVYGVVPLMSVDTAAAAAGAGVRAVVERLQAATVLGGSFRLALPQPDSEAARNPAAASNASAPCALHFPARDATGQCSDGGGGGGGGEWDAEQAATPPTLLYVTRPLPVDVDAVALGAAICDDLHTGPVLVSYVGPLLFADNALFGWGVGLRVWSVTFTPGPGSYDVPTLQPNASGMTGSGFPVVEVTTRTPGRGPLSGSFRLRVGWGGPAGAATTAPLPVNASAEELQTALLRAAAAGEGQPSPLLVNVSMGEPLLAGSGGGAAAAAVPPHPAASRSSPPTWLVRLSISPASTAAVWPGDGQEHHHGYDDVETDDGRIVRLFDRPAGGITLATVDDDGRDVTGGYIWAPPSASPHLDGRLRGSDARVEVLPLISELAADSHLNDQAVEAAQKGVSDSGLQSGAVFLFQRPSGTEGWQPLQRLDAPTSDVFSGRPVRVEFGQFGHALSLSLPHNATTATTNASATASGAAAGEGLLAVASPGTREAGALEVQALTCNLTAADGASLSFTFDGCSTTAPLHAATATGADLQRALEGLSTIQQVSVTPPSGRLCGGGNSSGAVTTTLITFLWPQDGDLPALTVQYNGTAATQLGARLAFVTDDVVQGAQRSSGSNTSGLATGAVLLYMAIAGPNSSVWVHSHSLTPPSGDPLARSGGYGWSVAASVQGAGGTVHTVAVGAPWYGGEVGVVYVYSRDTGRAASPQGMWALQQTLSPDPHQTGVGVGAGQHLRFGWALAFASEGDTLMVGAPGAADGTGAVWVFKRHPAPDAAWMVDQVLQPPATRPPEPGVAALRPRGFGHAVAISSTAAVVGAPGSDVTRLDTGARSAQASAAHAAAAGAAYVYDRLGWGDEGGYLQLRRVLVHELAAGGDQVGVSVAATDTVALVGGVPAAPAHGGEPNGVAGPIGFGQHRPGQSAPPGRPQHEVQWLTLGVRVALPAAASGASTRALANASVVGFFTVSWLRAAAVGAGPTASTATATEGGDGDPQTPHASTRRLPWDATPTMLRRALELDLGTGRLRVTRHVRLGAAGSASAALGGDAVAPLATEEEEGAAAGGAAHEPQHNHHHHHVYTWAVTFLEQQPSRFWAARGGGGGGGPSSTGSVDGLSAPRPTLPLLRVRHAMKVVASVTRPSLHGSNASGGGGINATAGSPLDGSQLAAHTLADATAATGDRRWAVMDTELSRRLGSLSRGQRDQTLQLHPATSGDAALTVTMRVFRANEAAPWPRASGYALLLTRDFASLPSPPNASVTASAAASGHGAGWVLQAQLQPHAPQGGDQFGAAVALSTLSTTAAAFVTAPARDLDHAAAAPGASAGSAWAYNLAFLNARVAVSRVPRDDPAGVRVVSEGEGQLEAISAGHARGMGLASVVARVPLSVCQPRCIVPPTTSSAAATPLRLYATVAAGNDFGVYDEAGVLPEGATATHAAAHPAVGVGLGGARGPHDYTHGWDAPTGSDGSTWHTLHARHQDGGAQPSDDAEAFHNGVLPHARGWVFPHACGAGDAVGTNDCLFTRRSDAFSASGAYDAAAMQDYVVAGPHPHLLRADAATPASINITITGDSVVESPHEMLHVRVALPGMRPLWGGDLWTLLAIADDGDGSIDGKRYFQTLPAPLEPLLGPHSPPPAAASPSRYGAATATDGFFTLLGAPSAGCRDGAPDCGAVAVLRLQVSGPAAATWTQVAVLDGGPGAANRSGSHVGTAVALSGGEPSAPLRLMAVSAPGAQPPTVSVYQLNATAQQPQPWAVHLVTLTPQTHSAALAATLHVGREAMPHPVSPQHGCGARGSLALSVDDAGEPLLALGCAGLEAVFVFRRPTAGASGVGSGGEVVAGSAGLQQAQWLQSIVLRASDFRARVAPGGSHPLRASLFGAALALSGHSLAVGAPAAAWGGGPQPPQHNTWHGQDDAAEQAPTRAVGSVWLFQLVLGVSTGDYQPPAPGEGADRSSSWGGLAHWHAADAMLAAGGGQSVAVYDDGLGDAVWAQHARLVPPAASPSSAQGTPGRVGGEGVDDPQAHNVWDQFGAAVGLDGDALVVGAPGRSLGSDQTRVTWDFETGDLRGWTPTGNAFARQPTFGDNPVHRAGAYRDVLGGAPAARSRHRGRYWLSSYDVRPPPLDAAAAAIARAAMVLAGARDGSGSTGLPAHDSTPADPTLAPPGTPAGTVQGDGPVGSLTSAPFVIGGHAIQLLVGGGCDASRVFVELRIDGEPCVPPLRATGACREEMARVSWDVARYAGHTGVVRVVDAASVGPWGHIAVDDIAFSWDAADPALRLPGAGAAFVYTRVLAPGESRGGWVPTTASLGVAPDAAARLSAQPRGRPFVSAPCPPGQALACVWQLDAELRAPVAHAGGGFGSAVGVSHASGIAVVAARDPVPPATAQEPRAARAAAAVAAYTAARASNSFGGARGRHPARAPMDPAASVAAALQWGLRSAEGGAAGAASSWRTDPTHVPDSVAGSGFDADGEAQQQPPWWRPLLPSDADDAAETPAAAGTPSSRVAAHAAAAAGRAAMTTTLHVFRSQPAVWGGRSGGGSSCGPLIRPRVWAPFPLTSLRQPGADDADGGGRGSGGGRQLHPGSSSSVSLSRFTVVVGAPPPLVAAGEQDAARGGGAGRPARGSSCWVADLSHTFLSLDPRDFTSAGGGGGPAAATGHGGGGEEWGAQLLDEAEEPGGSVPSYRIAALGVAQARFTVRENATARRVIVPVFRHGTWNDRLSFGVTGAPQALLAAETLHVQFATSDGSARGVSAAHAARCAALPPAQRSHALCGDYVQAAGTLTFPPGVSHQLIEVALVDDSCREPASETFTVQLLLPGGPRLLGPRHRVVVTIDDDDGDDDGSCASLVGGGGVG